MYKYFFFNYRYGRYKAGACDKTILQNLFVHLFRHCKSPSSILPLDKDKGELIRNAQVATSAKICPFVAWNSFYQTLKIFYFLERTQLWTNPSSWRHLGDQESKRSWTRFGRSDKANDRKPAVVETQSLEREMWRPLWPGEACAAWQGQVHGEGDCKGG